MGNYTEICVAGELKNSAPGEVRAMVEYIFSPWTEDKVRPPLPDHPFFACQRWEMLFGSSFYFEAEPSLTWRADDRAFSGRGNVKNYDGEIEHFLDWLAPHVCHFGGSFGGFFRYEEDVAPTLFWFTDGGLVTSSVECPDGVTL